MMAFSVNSVCMCLLLIEIGFVMNEGTTQNLRPEYIHPEGVENLDPYLSDFHSDPDPDPDPEDDYIPLPDHQETLEGLPIFLIEPKNSYTMKSKPATLLCRAANALQVYFKCNEVRVESSQFDHVDPHNGVRVVEAEVNVTRDELEEYFGGFSCQCVAWNSRGSINSEKVVVELAYIKKQFSAAPQSTSVELLHRAAFRCVPPLSSPPSTINWFRNGVPIEGDENLVIERASLQDMANYTCVAENVAGKRETEPAVLTVYVNGGWSEWSGWVPCRCGGTVSGRRRTRACTEPAPVNDGAPCRGPSVMKSDDCVQCQNGGVWTQWGDWSSCGTDCVRARMRHCTGTCSGPNVQHAACVDGLCVSGQSFYRQNTALLIGIGVIMSIMTAAAAVLCVWYRSRKIRPGYMMARTDTPKSCSARDKAAPDLTRSCNEYWMQGVDNHYDMPNVRDSYCSPLSSAGARSNHYEMKPYSPSGESASSCCTYTRTMTSQSSDYSTDVISNSPRVDVAVTLPSVPVGSSYRDNICLTVVK